MLFGLFNNLFNYEASDFYSTFCLWDSFKNYTIFVLESKTGKTIRTFLAETGTTKLAFTKGGNMLLSERRGKINFLDPENGAVKKQFPAALSFYFNNGVILLT